MRWLSFVSLWIILANVGFCQEPPPKTGPPARFVRPTVVTTQSSSAGVQILAEMKIIEIDRKQLKGLGLGEAPFNAHLQALPDNVRHAINASHQLANRNSPHPATPIFRVLNPDAPVLGTLMAMCDDRRVKVIAEPKMVTVSGRKAELNVGRDVPIRTPTKDGKTKTEQKFVGTRWTLLPSVKPDGKLRLQVRFSVSHLASGRATGAGEPLPGPIRSTTVETAVEIWSGQTVVLGGPTVLESGNREVSTLTLLTARIVDSVSDWGQVVPRPVPTSQATRPRPSTDAR